MALAELIVKLGIRGVEEVKSGLDKIRGGVDTAADAAKRGASVFERYQQTILAVSHSLLEHAKAAEEWAKSQAEVVGAAAFDSYVQYDNLARGLASVSDNAQDLSGQLSRLKEVAKLPGLGFEEAVKGSLQLQAVGLSANLAERAIAGFGNAIASAGGGKDNLNNALLAMSQIVARGKVTMDNINQIANSVPQIRAWMTQAFGTADGEALEKKGVGVEQFISGIIAQAEKMPKVTGGIGNAIENLGDNIKNSLRPLGHGIADMLIGAGEGVDTFFVEVEKRANQIGEVFSAAGKSGVIADVLKEWTSAFSSVFGEGFQQGVIRVVSIIAAVVGNLPKIFQEVGAYLKNLFDVIVNNVSETFKYISTLATSALAKTTMTLAMLLDAMDKANNLDFGGARDSIQAIPVILNSIDAVSPIHNPKYQELPKAPFADLWKGVTSDADRYQKMIGANIKPLSNLPDGVTYGGKQQMPGQTEEASLLTRIERNTKGSKDALDALSLRRQVYGGGDAARVGVTPAELGGGGAAGSNYNPYRGYVGNNSRSAASELERVIYSLIEDRMARGGLGGFRGGRH